MDGISKSLPRHSLLDSKTIQLRSLGSGPQPSGNWHKSPAPILKPLLLAHDLKPLPLPQSTQPVRAHSSNPPADHTTFVISWLVLVPRSTARPPTIISHPSRMSNRPQRGPPRAKCPAAQLQASLGLRWPSSSREPQPQSRAISELLHFGGPVEFPKRPKTMPLQNLPSPV